MVAKSLILFFAALAATCADDRIRFIFYHEPTFITEYSVLNFFTIFNHPNFNQAGETVVFHYGADQSVATPQVADVVNSYAANGQFNFIVIDYDTSGTISTGNAVSLAEGISTALINLFEVGYKPENMNLIGFSLGAQIQARAARRIAERTSRRHIVGRLTGLDPLALALIAGNNIGHLGPTDASFVESIHTESNMRGDLESAGHVQFLVNGGVTQPSCAHYTLAGNRADCSHVFSLSIWAESVRAISPAFASLQCDTWALFLSGACNSNTVGHLGRWNSNSAARGSFFLQTNDQAPWSRTQATPSA